VTASRFRRERQCSTGPPNRDRIAAAVSHRGLNGPPPGEPPSVAPGRATRPERVRESIRRGRYSPWRRPSSECTARKSPLPTPPVDFVPVAGPELA